MLTVEEQLSEYGKSFSLRPDESKIEETILTAKSHFYERAVQRECYYSEFMYQQMCYIKKRWWILQFLALFLSGVLIHGTEDTLYIQRQLGISASLFVILVFPELWRNRSSNSLEIEEAAYFPLRQIYAARLFAFAAVDGIFLVLFAGILSLTQTVSIQEIAIHFFLPMAVTCCICFRSLCARSLASEYVAYALAFFWSAVWNLVVMNGNIYRRISIPVWIVICGMVFFYLTYTVRKMLRKSDSDFIDRESW